MFDMFIDSSEDISATKPANNKQKVVLMEPANTRSGQKTAASPEPQSTATTFISTTPAAFALSQPLSQAQSMSSYLLYTGTCRWSL